MLKTLKQRERKYHAPRSQLCLPKLTSQSGMPDSAHYSSCLIVSLQVINQLIRLLNLSIQSISSSGDSGFALSILIEINQSWKIRKSTENMNHTSTNSSSNALLVMAPPTTKPKP